MRATALKQTGCNAATFHRSHSSIDRAALPAPFPCLYRPFPCSPPLSLPPFSTSPSFSFVPPSLCQHDLFIPSHGSPYFSLYPHSGLRTIRPTLLFSSPRSLVFIYFPTFPSAPPCFSSPSDVRPRFFALPLSAQLFNLPRADAVRLGATSLLSSLPLPRRPSSTVVCNYPIRAIRPRRAPTIIDSTSILLRADLPPNLRRPTCLLPVLFTGRDLDSTL